MRAEVGRARSDAAASAIATTMPTATSFITRGAGTRRATCAGRVDVRGRFVNGESRDEIEA